MKNETQIPEKQVKPNQFQRWFWFCAGIDVDLLIGNHEKFPTPLTTEYSKYIGIGTAVCFTAIFAAISATFALSFMQDSQWWWCIPFGAFWGVIIFFLDRYIVSTMRKDESFRRQFWSASPRIAMACVFAFVISVPLELVIFKGSIEKELFTMNTGFVAGYQKDCDNQIEGFTKQIAEIDKKLAIKHAYAV